MQSDNEQNKSCRICGFFVPQETSVGNAGYCLYFDDTQKSGESLKIPTGSEKEIAGPCNHNFRRVPAVNYPALKDGACEGQP